LTSEAVALKVTLLPTFVGDVDVEAGSSKGLTVNDGDVFDTESSVRVSPRGSFN